MPSTSGCEPGIAAVIPRIGSVSSCSGEGRAKGDRSTRAAAHRMVATVVCTSVLEYVEDEESCAGVEAGEVEKELRDRGNGKLGKARFVDGEDGTVPSTSSGIVICFDSEVAKHVECSGPLSGDMVAGPNEVAVGGSENGGALQRFV